MAVGTRTFGSFGREKTGGLSVERGFCIAGYSLCYQKTVWVGSCVTAFRVLSKSSGTTQSPVVFHFQPIETTRKQFAFT